MNYIERKTITYRILSTVFLLASLVLTTISTYLIIKNKPEEIILILISLIITAGFAILQGGFIIKGWRNQSNLNKIVFNENDRINTIPIFAVSIGLATSIALVALGIAVYVVRDDLTIKASMLVVASIGGYLLANCLIYFLYLILFKKRELNLKDLIK